MAEIGEQSQPSENNPGKSIPLFPEGILPEGVDNPSERGFQQVRDLPGVGQIGVGFLNFLMPDLEDDLRAAILRGDNSVILATEMGPVSITSEGKDPAGELILKNPYFLQTVKIRPDDPEFTPPLRVHLPQLTARYENPRPDDEEDLLYSDPINEDGGKITFLAIRSKDVLRAIHIEVGEPLDKMTLPPSQ